MNQNTKKCDCCHEPTDETVSTKYGELCHYCAELAQVEENYKNEQG